jgi:hypothetical protein
MAGNANHCSFVLLAEFHILEGAQLKYQFPQPLGVDERYGDCLSYVRLSIPPFSVLAMSMLPDGAETQLDDWTIFFLNQTPFNTISPVLALDTPDTKPIALPGEPSEEHSDKPELLCVLNLVRTRHDKSLDRYAFRLFLLRGDELNLFVVVLRCSPSQFAHAIHLFRSLRYVFSENFFCDEVIDVPSHSFC